MLHARTKSIKKTRRSGSALQNALLSYMQMQVTNMNKKQLKEEEEHFWYMACNMALHYALSLSQGKWVTKKAKTEIQDDTEEKIQFDRLKIA